MSQRLPSFEHANTNPVNSMRRGWIQSHHPFHAHPPSMNLLIELCMINNNPKERCFCSHHLLKHSFKQKLDHLIRQRNHITSSNKADDSQYYSLGVHPLMSLRYLNTCMNQRTWLRWYIYPCQRIKYLPAMCIKHL